VYLGGSDAFTIYQGGPEIWRGNGFLKKKKNGSLGLCRM